MPAKSIAFLNMKGGVGKTTLSVNVASVLAKLRHKKVLVVDLDPLQHLAARRVPG